MAGTCWRDRRVGGDAGAVGCGGDASSAGFALGAAEALLDMIGFSDVVRDDRKYVTTATPDQTPGYILT